MTFRDTMEWVVRGFEIAGVAVPSNGRPVSGMGVDFRDYDNDGRPDIVLTALTGELPSQEVTERFDLAALRLPVKLPLSLPSKLVEQRPDVRAAEAQLYAELARLQEYLARKVERVQEVLELHDECCLLVLGLEREVDG